MGTAMEDWSQLISFRPDPVLRPKSGDELKSMLERVHRGELANLNERLGQP